MVERRTESVDPKQMVEPASPPVKIGPYRLEEKLGSGGMGVVYRAFDQRLERRVAVKHIQSREKADHRARERLRREARTVAGLNHPAIVQIHDIIDSGDGDWIVMELVEGRTLHQLLQSGPLPLSQALYLALEVLDGLAEAHAKGVVHRDLKTENVMVTSYGHAKILDFGLAKRLWTEEAGKEVSLSVQGTILGTGRAMSPEQVLGEDVDHRSDLFSFGTLLYEMVSGERPFGGSSLVLTMAQVCSEDHRSLSEIAPELPAELAHLVDRLLAKRPEQRPQSAREVAAALSQLAGIPLPERSSLDSASRDPSSESTVPEPTPTEIAVWPHRAEESTTGIYLRTLVQLVPAGLDELRETARPEALRKILSEHRRLVHNLALGFETRTYDHGEGLLILFERPVDAVQFSLDHRRKLEELRIDSGVPLTARVGIHLGEVELVREGPAGEISQDSGFHEIEGPARRLVEGLIALARPGQILLTREATQLSRHLLDSRSGTDLQWIEHGRYRFEGVEEPVSIYEVGAESLRLLESSAPGVERVSTDWIAQEMGIGRQGLTMGALVLMVLLTLGVVWWLQVREGGGIQTRPSLAVLPFSNITSSSELEWMGTAFQELLVAELEATQKLRVVTVDQSLGVAVEQDLQDEDDLFRAGRLLGVDYLLLGYYLMEGEGNKVRVTVRLKDTRRREHLHTFSDDGDSGQLHKLAKGLGLEVREQLGLPAEKNSLGKSALPSNNLAIRSYSEGLEALRSFDANRAKIAFEQVVAIEPENPMGYAMLSQALRSLGYDAEARENAASAYERSDGLSQLHSLWIRGAYQEAEGLWEEAIETYGELLALHPDSVENGLLLAGAQIAGSRADEALETLATLRRLPAPGGKDPRIDLTEAAAYEAMFNYPAMLRSARAVLDQVNVEVSPYLVAEARRLEGFAHYYQRERDLANVRLADALRLFEKAGHKSKMADILFVQAFLRSVDGELSAAGELLRDALELHQETGSKKGVAKAQNGLAYMLQAKGDLAEAEGHLRAALGTARELGDPYRVATYLDSFTWVLIQQGQLKIAGENARDLLGLAEELGDQHERAYGLFYSGRVIGEGGDLERARTFFEDSIALGNRISQATLEGFALRGAIELYLEMDDQEAADQALTKLRSLEPEMEGRWEIAANYRVEARMLYARRQYEDAINLGLEAANQLYESERYGQEQQAMVEAALAQVEAGFPEDAAATLEELRRRHVGDCEDPRKCWLETVVEARLALAAGNGSRFRNKLEEVRDQARTQGFVGWELLLDLELGRVDLETRGDSQAVEKVLERARSSGHGFVAGRAESLLSTTSP